MSEPTSLRRRLLRQFLVLALLPLTAVSAISLVLLVPSLLALGEQRNLELATVVRDQVQQQLAAHQRLALVMANEIGQDRLRGDAIAEFLRAAVEGDQLLLAAYLCDASGVVEQVALPPSSGLNAADMIGLDQSAQPHYRRARLTQQPVWSETFLSLLTGRITAVLAVQAGARTLLLELALDNLSSSLADLGRAAHSEPVILDHVGRVIGHPRAELALQQANLRNLPLVRQALEGQQGSASIQADGVAMLAQALPIAPLGWTVLVMQPLRAVLGPLVALGVALAAVLGLAVAVAVWLSWMLARRSGLEVERLALAAEAAASTPDDMPPPPFGISEFRAVWLRLQALFAELHERDRQTEAARRDLQAVLDAATEVAIIATDLGGRVTVFSSGAQKMLGRSTADVVGRLTPIAWHDADEVRRRGEELSRELQRPVEGFEVFVCRARETGHEVRDWTLVRADGTRLDASLAVTAMRAMDGRLRGYLGIAIDVSQRRRAEELEVARRAADVASQAKSEFLSRMSHELRTPLNAVLGYAQLMDSSTAQPPTAQQRSHLQQIQRSGWHLVQLIDDVLDLTRIEAGTLRVSLEAIDAAKAVAAAAEIVAPLFTQLGITFAQEWPDRGGGRLGPVRGDMTRLTQVLVNLLSNAAKYNRPGGHVRLVGEVLPGRGLALRVGDDGLGLDAAQIAQLFQPFNRLGREGGPVEGSGIGLVITKRLVELMAGTIEVVSEPGRGSTFTVVLPQADQPAANQGGATVAALRGRSGEARGLTVYIEDNEVNALLMREIIALRPAVQLLHAATAAEGLGMMRRQRPDLLLLDMHLPDAKGDEVLDLLATDARLRDVPVIVVSADATRLQIENARQRGVRNYLTKPLNVAEVLEAVDAVLGKGQAAVAC